MVCLVHNHTLESVAVDDFALSESLPHSTIEQTSDKQRAQKQCNQLGSYNSALLLAV